MMIKIEKTDVFHKFILCICILLNGALTNAQNEPIKEATIEKCYTWSRDNYPLISQLDMIDKSREYNLSNASHGNLPQIHLNGKASYQSDVTSLPIEIPNMEIPVVSKDQYQIYIDAYQPLTNFHNINANKKNIKINGEIEKQQVEVQLYNLKERINQIYFGILLIDEKIEQYEIIISDIDSTIVKVEAAIQNGTATLNDKNLLSVERIAISQKIAENKFNKLAYLQMLSQLTGKNISENTNLEKSQTVALSEINNRPELKLFDLQNQSLILKENQVNNRMIPNIGLFGQGGYGRPTLNYLENDFTWYYIAGIKLNWNLSNLYNNKNNKESIKIAREKISTERETFLLNTTLTKVQQSAEVTKFKNLMESDKEIIKLRLDILNTAKVQLDNGLITTIDYVTYLNDVNKANQMLLLHETQLLLAEQNLKITSGN